MAMISLVFINIEDKKTICAYPISKDSAVIPRKGDYIRFPDKGKYEVIFVEWLFGCGIGITIYCSQIETISEE